MKQERNTLRDGIETLTNPHAGGYHDNRDFASSGVLNNIISTSPRTALGSKGEDKQTSAMTFGNLYHVLMFEPHLIDEQYAVLDKDQRPNTDKDFRNKENKEWKAGIEAQAEQEGKTVVSQMDMEQARAMFRAVKETTDIDAYLLGNGKRELAYFVKEFPFYNPILGQVDTCPVRILTDYHDDALILDLKTYGGDDLNERTWFNRVWSHGYHIQAALYADVLMHVFNMTDEADFNFYWLAQEKDAPYSAATFTLTQDLRILARKEYEVALALFKMYRLEGKTPPTYFNGERCDLDVPKWAYDATEERVARAMLSRARWSTTT